MHVCACVCVYAAHILEVLQITVLIKEVLLCVCACVCLCRGVCVGGSV